MLGVSATRAASAAGACLPAAAAAWFAALTRVPSSAGQTRAALPGAAAAASAAGVSASGLESPCVSLFSTSRGQQQQQQGGDLPPGQAFLASLVDYEKLGMPKAAGVADGATTAAASDGSGDPNSSSSSSSKGFDLSTMRALLAAMGNPQQQLSVVHIAGTKGKGSVAALISGVLRASGYKVGTYTSPHMFDMRERIVVGGVGASGLRPSHAPPAGANGGGGGAGSGSAAAAAAAVPAAVPISAEEFEALAARAAEAASSVAQPSTTAAASSSSSSSSGPSHFEVVTAMAFQHFVDEGVDIAVIETGLGGATDATNVFGPQQMQAAVLTAVGLDHVDALGGSLESIAAAKAGIMKPGVPVVVGPQDSSTGSGGCGSNGGSSGSSVVMRVFRAAAGAADMQCPLLLAEEVVQVAAAPTRPSDANGSSSSSSSSNGGGTASGIVILPGPGEHLARQLLSVSTTPAGAAAVAAAATHPTEANAGPPPSAAATAAPDTLSLQLPSIQLQLVGQHQAGNVQTAVAAALTLAARGWFGINGDSIARGLQAAWLPGRFQVAQLPGSPTHYVLDGAHTADSAAALGATLRAAFPQEPVVLLLAMAADKEHREVLQALRAIQPKVAVFTSVPIAGSHARSAPPGTLAAHWQAAAMLSTGKPFRCRELIQAGLGAAVDKARHELGAYGGKGVVVVTGSLHAVAAALKQLQLQ